MFHCMYIPHFLYPFIHWWEFRLFPRLLYCAYWCNKQVLNTFSPVFLSVKIIYNNGYSYQTQQIKIWTILQTIGFFLILHFSINLLLWSVSHRFCIIPLNLELSVVFLWEHFGFIIWGRIPQMWKALLIASYWGKIVFSMTFYWWNLLWPLGYGSVP